MEEKTKLFETVSELLDAMVVDAIVEIHENKNTSTEPFIIICDNPRQIRVGFINLETNTTYEIKMSYITNLIYGLEILNQKDLANEVKSYFSTPEQRVKLCEKVLELAKSAEDKNKFGWVWENEWWETRERYSSYEEMVEAIVKNMAPFNKGVQISRFLQWKDEPRMLCLGIYCEALGKQWLLPIRAIRDSKDVRFNSPEGKKEVLEEICAKVYKANSGEESQLQQA